MIETAQRQTERMAGMKTVAERKVSPVDLLAMAQEARRDAKLYPLAHLPDEEPDGCYCLACCCLAEARKWEGQAKNLKPVWLKWNKKSETYLMRAHRHYKHERSA